MTGARILVVDDDPNQLASVERVLRRSGFEVDTAPSGRIGLRKVWTRTPDLVFLDVSMPTMSGHEFLRRLRRLERRRRGGGPTTELWDTPVVFLTALADAHQRVSGLDAGAIDYITKPFEPDELRARARRHLRRVREDRLIAAVERSQYVGLQTELDVVRDTVASCQRMMADLESDLDLAAVVRGDDDRRDLLDRIRRDAEHVRLNLARIAGEDRTWEKPA